MNKAIEQLVKEYIRYCYGSLDEDSPQYGEVKQAFIMGVWQMLQIAKDETYTKDTSLLIEKEIRVYKELRFEMLLRQTRRTK